MSIAIGTPAPDFTLFNSEKESFTLSALRGKNVVLLFIPQAFTSVCTAEFCEMRDNLNVYNGLNAEIVGISVDSVFTLNKWKQDENYNFTLLSDFNKDVSRLYGTIYEDWIFGMKGVSKRSAFVIDKDGMVQYAEVLENAGDMPNLADVRATLEKLN